MIAPCSLKFKYQPPVGNRIKISSAQATSEEIKERATDGGVVTAILSYLLDHTTNSAAPIAPEFFPSLLVKIFIFFASGFIIYSFKVFFSLDKNNP